MRKRRMLAGALIGCGAIAAPFIHAPGPDVPASLADDGGPDEYAFPGLEDEVEIVLDSAGIPHIYAENTEDVFFAQGMNVARDRLFQIDLHRRSGLGELSSVLGPGFVEQDRASRLFLYRGDMEEEWESYGPDARDAAENFTEGINAYVDWLEQNPEHLPPEFTELDYEPAHWEPEDVVRVRSNSLSMNADNEVLRSQIACADGIETDAMRVRLEPQEHEVQVPEGLDPCSVPEDVLDTYHLATAPVSLDPDGEHTADPRDLGWAGIEGSNSWVVSPERTETGRPLLAGDPHRNLSAPSLRYIAHLSAPGMDVIGAGEPALPGVSMGHNGQSAFGLTFFPMDQQDLYVYELDPDDPGRYRYGDGWEEIRTETERVEVAGGEKEEVELDFTRHGPVIEVDEEEGLAFALRTTWTEPGTAAYFDSMELMGTENFADFEEVMAEWGGPPMNYTYADASGDIGWSPGGMPPVREGEGYDGLMPVPGDGSYEWDGFEDGSELPSQHNPSSGFFSTANEYNMPEGHPTEVGYEWEAPYRQERITEVLEADDSVSVEDSQALQGDTVSLSSRELLPLLEGLEDLDPDGSAAAAVELLRGWDGDSSADSAEAALYHSWLMRHLGQAFYRAVSPEAAEFIPFAQHISTLTNELNAPERWFEQDPESVRDEVLVRSLSAAYEDVAEQLGEDPSQWRWGDLHRTTFEHALHGGTGPFERGGGWDTVNVSLFDPESRGGVQGASFRMVLDVGDWDASQAINAPGQSGSPDSPHYDDLAPQWHEGEYVPLHYSRTAVMDDAVRVITLNPKAG